ncbi:hypothetical protein BRARA_F01887 [Brassica rapa]|uniref:DUF1985 domain-containing protein n=1 Tax=Brassica campestris TaxID=3711 RepID=A0A397YYS4_BRACM|nr:hypothetical protein BRARA_F01887 [Brassica rapa]
MIKLPDRIFADGEEPVGVRVLAYHRSSGIQSILRVLSDDEIQFIKDKPTFSGKFARYILSRQLKVNKEHQVWFRFAGNSIRFSLKEFAIVTGLPCGKYPKKSWKNKKERMEETPMLRKKTMVDKEIRIKYALLALVSSVLMPTNLKSKISKEYVEMIKDLNEFFSFPWGRLAFDMLMTSIKERDEIALCQNTFALKGFVHAMQLVMVEAVPVKCIIEDNSSHPVDSEYEDYSDVETDPKVENVLRLHSKKQNFNNLMFKRGLTMADVERMGGKGKGKKRETKAGKKAVAPENVSDPKFATLLYDKMKPKISRFHETIKNLNETVKVATQEFASMESRV